MRSGQAGVRVLRGVSGQLLRAWQRQKLISGDQSRTLETRIQGRSRRVRQRDAVSAQCPQALHTKAARTPRLALFPLGGRHISPPCEAMGAYKVR